MHLVCSTEGRNTGRQEDWKVGRWKQVLEMECRKVGSQGLERQVVVGPPVTHLN